MIYWPNKQPQEVRDFGMNWEPVLAELNDDNITSVVWTRTLGDIIFTSPGHTAKTASIRLSAGTDGQEHILRCTITTQGGLTLSKSGFIRTRSL